MEVQTVTTADGSLLDAVRSTLADADTSLLCVAYAHTRGVHLIERELRASRGTRLVVTTAFDQNNGAAISLAASMGAEVRTLNPGSGSSYHPKVYLSRRGRKIEAVVGSANLTGGLATNIEAAMWLRGKANEPALASLSDWAEGIWEDRRCADWLPRAAESVSEDQLEPFLLDAISRAVARDAEFLTLGPRPAKNKVTEVTRDEVLVSTERSASRTGQAASIPAWMFNIAWDYLNEWGELSNDVLLNHLRVHRSSAVCAILARIPGIDRVPGRAALRLSAKLNPPAGAIRR